MGTLSGKQIIGLVEEGKLIIEPFDRNLIQPATYDLRLGNKVLASPLGPHQLGIVVDLNEQQPKYEIQPGQMAGVLSFEKLRIPLDICGRFGIRSALARKGINAFGGLQLDPGFKGRLTMNLLNVGPEPIQISFMEPLFSVEFQRLEEPAVVPYSGPYQNQDDFPGDQYNYILQARTTSLAEIPRLRQELSKLNVFIEELEERLPDPDEGLDLKPEIKERLAKSSELSRSSLLTASEFRKKLNL